MVNRATVYQLTPPRTRNPFFTSLAEPMRALGWDYRFSIDLDEIEQAVKERSAPTLVHVHQLEALYQDRDPQVAGERARRLVDFLMSVALHGTPILHTFHNRRRHDGKQSALEHYALQMLEAVAERVIVLGHGATDAAAQFFGSDKIRVVPHQHYSGVYGERVPKELARARLALPESERLFLCLGDLKPYKGHELLIDAFASAQLEGARLALVGGHSPDPSYARALERRAENAAFGRIRVVAGHVPDELMAQWLSATDFAVFGFQDILMSGSLMLALSYGVPVLAPSIGCLPEYVDEDQNGWLYQATDTASLCEAFQRACPKNPEDVIRGLEPYAPHAISARLTEVYEDAERSVRGA